MSSRLTPTEQRIYDLLADGLPHTSAEVKAAMGDDLAEDAAVTQHMIRMRAKMEEAGTLDIVNYQRAHVYYYRLVALISHRDDG